MNLSAIVGCMFAAKTTRLLQLASAVALHAPSWRVVLVHPKRTTEARPAFRTHDGQVPELARVLELDTESFCSALVVMEADVVLVDEVQFFAPGIVDAMLQRVRERQTRIVAAGLSSDYRRDPWPTVRELVRKADSVESLWATCARCYDKAYYTYRKVKSEERVLVGGTEEYEPRCLACHKLGWGA